MKGITFGAEMDVWLTPKKESFITKTLRLENGSETFKRSQVSIRFENFSFFQSLDCIDTVQIRYDNY